MNRVSDLALRIREAALLEGDFVLSSGERSRFYVDKYLFSTEPNLLRDVAGELAEQIPDGVERLAGVELGAVPLVVATALATGLPYVIVRKSAKEHGSSAGQSIEGNLEEGETVLVHGAAGGVGTASIQVANGLGARAIAVVSSDEKEQVARDDGEEIGGFPFRALLRMDELRVVKRD